VGRAPAPGPASDRGVRQRELQPVRPMSGVTGGYAVQMHQYPGGLFEPPPNFAKLAESVDCFGETVSRNADVGPTGARHGAGAQGHTRSSGGEGAKPGVSHP
jgi:hypothetical protein